MFICYPTIYDMTMLALVSYMKILIEFGTLFILTVSLRTTNYITRTDILVIVTEWYLSSKSSLSFMHR
jgi:hypothetical protein